MFSSLQLGCIVHKISSLHKHTARTASKNGHYALLSLKFADVYFVCPDVLNTP